MWVGGLAEDAAGVRAMVDGALALDAAVLTFGAGVLAAAQGYLLAGYLHQENPSAGYFPRSPSAWSFRQTALSM